MGSLDYMENYHPLLGDGRNGAMEMPKHGNGSKSDVGPFPLGNLSKTEKC